MLAVTGMKSGELEYWALDGQMKVVIDAEEVKLLKTYKTF